MFGSIDLCGLVDGTMVKPEDDVVIIVKPRGGYGNGFIGVLGEDGQGACGIEGETSDGIGVYAMLAEDALDGIADASPDVVCRLFLCHWSARRG